MSQKKPISLAGRKRTKDLESEQPSQAIQPNTLNPLNPLNPIEQSAQPQKQDKKAELMSMIHSEINLNPVPAPAAPTPQVIISKPMTEEISAPLGVAVVYEKEVKAAVNFLIKFHSKMRDAGTANRREYSFYEQNKRLVSEIKNLLAEKADFYESKGLDDEENRRACQQYINDLREGLRSVGIFVNYLEVRPVKSPA